MGWLVHAKQLLGASLHLTPYTTRIQFESCNSRAPFDRDSAFLARKDTFSGIFTKRKMPPRIQLNTSSRTSEASCSSSEHKNRS